MPGRKAPRKQVVSFSTEPALAFHAPEELLTFLDQVYNPGEWQIGIDFTTAQETESSLQHDRGAESQSDRILFALQRRSRNLTITSHF